MRLVRGSRQGFESTKVDDRKKKDNGVLGS